MNKKIKVIQKDINQNDQAVAGKYITANEKSALLRLMSNRHGVVKIEGTEQRKQAIQYLNEVPYNALVYPALEVWGTRGKSAKTFLSGTTITDLYTLYRFDNFLKGKLTEISRIFEGAFLGSISYHLENQYKVLWNSYPDKLRKLVKKHNIGYKVSKNSITWMPLWEQFFLEDTSLIDAIALWDSLSKDRFLKPHKHQQSTNDRLNRRRFAEDEYDKVLYKLPVKKIRDNVLADMADFVGMTQDKYKKSIGISGFPQLLDLLRTFRNASSHPGAFVNTVHTWDRTKNARYPQKFEAFLEKDVPLSDFWNLAIYLAPAHVVEEIMHDIRLQIIKYKHEGLGTRQTQRLFQKVGIPYEIDKW